MNCARLVSMAMREEVRKQLSLSVRCSFVIGGSVGRLTCRSFGRSSVAGLSVGRSVDWLFGRSFVCPLLALSVGRSIGGSSLPSSRCFLSFVLSV